MSGIAVVTGASRGLGLGLVKTLVDRTMLHIVGTCRPDTFNALDKAYHQSHNLPGDRVTLFPLDVTQETSIVQFKDRLTELSGHLSHRVPLHLGNGHQSENSAQTSSSKLMLLINSAGMLIPEKNLSQIDPETLLNTFKLNAFGPLLVVKHLSPMMHSNPKSAKIQESPDNILVRPMIVNISARTGSISDNRLGGWYSYRSSKAALNQFTRTMSIELARKGILCIALHPGTVDTDLSRRFVSNVPKDKLFTPMQSAEKLVDVILSGVDTGTFVDYSGKKIEW